MTLTTGRDVLLRPAVPQRVSLCFPVWRRSSSSPQSVHDCCPVSDPDRFLRRHRPRVHHSDLPTDIESPSHVRCTLSSRYQPDRHCRDQYIEQVLRPGSSLVALQETVLNTRPDDTETWLTLCKQAKELRHAFSGGMVGLLGSSGMLSLEVTYGRIGAKDLKLLIEKAKMLSGRLLGLASFQVSAAMLSRSDV